MANKELGLTKIVKTLQQKYTVPNIVKAEIKRICNMNNQILNKLRDDNEYYNGIGRKYLSIRTSVRY